MASKDWHSRPENIARQKELKKIWYENNKESERVSARQRAKIRREDINKKYIEYKSKLKCEVCGFSHPAVLDFHHTDPTKKEFNPSQKEKITSWKRFLNEVEKCVVLCANCHRIHHYNERNNMEQEIWKDIIGYEGLYQVSNYGNIRNCVNGGKNLRLYNVGDKKKYFGITLVNKDGKKRFRVHRVVAEHFIDNPLKLSQVNHKDNNPFNNKIDNLEWVSHRENQSHRSLSSGKKSSKYVGVSKSGNKWRAQIQIGDERISLGVYNSEEEAYAARVNFTKENNIVDRYL